MKLKLGMTVTVKLDDEELRFLIVRTNDSGEERLSLNTPLARLLGGMAINDTLTWRVRPTDDETMRVKLVKVEEATE